MAPKPCNTCGGSGILPGDALTLDAGLGVGGMDQTCPSCGGDGKARDYAGEVVDDGR